MSVSATVVLRVYERSWIRAVQTNNLRGLLGIRRIGEMPQGRVTERNGVKKWVDERINKCILR